MEHCNGYMPPSGVHFPASPASGAVRGIEMSAVQSAGSYGSAPPSWGFIPTTAATPSTPSSSNPKQPTGYGQSQDQEKEKEEERTSYNGILVTTNCCAQFCNDLRWFHRHFQRSQEADELLKDVASPDEKLHLAKELGCKQMVVVNIMVWRRSLMKILLIFMIITAIVNGNGARRQWNAAWAQYSATPIKNTYAKWKAKAPSDRNGFQHYSIAVIKEVQRLMMGQAAIVRAIGSVAINILSCFSLLMCLLASTNWLHFRYSRKKLMLAWFLSVAAPFLVSMVPARLFVNWARAREIIEIYKVELDQQFGIDAKLQMLKDNCGRIVTEGDQKVLDAGAAFEKVCGIVDEKVPHKTMTVPTSWKFWRGFSPVTIDLEQVHKACATGRGCISDKKPQEALKKAQEACRMMQGLLDQYANDYGETPQVIHYFADQIQHVAEATISMMLALQNLATLFPAALSIAPGLLKGALRMKMLVPQSIIPGMFVLVLPWLYCPLTWCMYSLAFQLVGNPFLLVGLILTAFNPISYFAVGQLYQLSKPMTDEQVLGAIQRIQRAIKVISMLSYCFLGYFVGNLIWMYARRQNFFGHNLERFGIKGESEQAQLWGQRNESRILQMVFRVDNWAEFLWNVVVEGAAFLSSMMRSFYLTSAAGVDWMVDEMVNFRAVEKAMLESHQDESDIVAEYNARMDQLLALDKGMRASVFSKPKEGMRGWFGGLFQHHQSYPGDGWDTSAQPYTPNAWDGWDASGQPWYPSPQHCPANAWSAPMRHVG